MNCFRTIQTFEEERTMAFVTRVERLAMQRRLPQGLSLAWSYASGARHGDERIRISIGARGSQNRVPLISLRLRTLYRMMNRTINPESRSPT
jgi:hypothetical protein